MGGKKGGQSSLDKFKQKVEQVWRPTSTVSEHTSQVVKAGSSHPIKDTINPEKFTPDESTVSLDPKSGPGSLEGKVRQTVKVTRDTNVSKPNRDSEIVNRAGKHTVSIQVEAPLITFLKGKWGLTQKQIEKETGVKIIFPTAKGESSVVIEGASQENVTKASEKIANVLEQAMESPYLDYSHFISLPLAIHPELTEKLQSFQKSILEEVDKIQAGDLEGSSKGDSLGEVDVSQSLEGPNVSVNIEVLNNSEHVRVDMDSNDTTLSRSSPSPALGIDSSIFIKPQTFHLTVLMLKLWTKDRVSVATEVLKGVSSKVIDALENRPVSIRLKGLACMRGSPAKAYVLYAPVEEVGGEGRLSRACQVIIDAFVEAGLVAQKDVHHTLKLHATLMNARHRKRKNWTKRNESFDARGIFEKYGSEDWGEYVLPEAHLSQIFAFDESGYYHCCVSIPFPGSINVE